MIVNIEDEFMTWNSVAYARTVYVLYVYAEKRITLLEMVCIRLLSL